MQQLVNHLFNGGGKQAPPIHADVRSLPASDTTHTDFLNPAVKATQKVIFSTVDAHDHTSNPETFYFGDDNAIVALGVHCVASLIPLLEARIEKAMAAIPAPPSSSSSSSSASTTTTAPVRSGTDYYTQLVSAVGDQAPYVAFLRGHLALVKLVTDYFDRLSKRSDPQPQQQQQQQQQQPKAQKHH
jgi:hypothetical protein